MKLTVRVGQSGETDEFDSLTEAVDYLNQLGVSKPTNWIPAGFETERYGGDDYVQFVWTELGVATQMMTTSERMFVEDNLPDFEA